MRYVYQRAAVRDLDLLTDTRVRVLRLVNGLPDTADMEEVRARSREYYRRALEDGSHVAYLVWDGGALIGAGGVSFFQVMPTYHTPSGQKAYIMNIYVEPEYRRQGIARETLDRLVREAEGRGVTAVSLEATDMGRPLYEAYGFVAMENEMELPESYFRRDAARETGEE